MLNGVYDVRFEADSGCSDVPETARIRQYTAHADGSFLITLTGAQFGPPFQPGYDWNVMYQNEHDGTFSLFFQDPEIWELLTPDSYVSIFGDGHGVVTDRDHIELDAWANVSFCPQREEDDPYPECAVTEIVCRSDHLKVTLTRH